jgi:hypothetical protein
VKPGRAGTQDKSFIAATCKRAGKQAEQHNIKSRACTHSLLQLLGTGSSSEFNEGERENHTYKQQVKKQNHEWHTNNIIYCFVFV